MGRQYRIVTVTFRGNIEVFEWHNTYAKCKQQIIARWHHWPPFAFISSITDMAKLKRKYVS